jgi:dehydrogenase/reductase SDR family member 12
MNASFFLLTEMPTFTRVGYACRRIGWPAAERDFRGERWLVTGASAGIGREIARAAATAGAQVIAVARNLQALHALAAECANGAGRIVPVAADLSLVAANRALVTEAQRHGPIDVLVNNVGVMLDAPATTVEGIDAAFATNLLGGYVLTEGLIAAGGLSADARIVNISSGGMYAVPLDVAALDRQSGYDGTLAYARHKRAQVVLSAAWRATAGANRDVYVMHPGWVATPGVERSLPNFQRLLRPLLREPAAGGDTALWLAAERPRQATQEGIWFDRRLRSAHVWHGSRGGDAPAVLLDFLERTAASV